MKKRLAVRKKKENKEIAMGRLDSLFSSAQEVYKDHMDLAKRYVKIARKVQMKYRVRMPSEYRRKFCKHCNAYLVPSVNCRVRLQGNHIVYYCQECKRIQRFVHKKK